MKKTLIVLAMATATSLSAADILGNLTLAPVGVLQTENLNGESQFGVGVDVGYKVNPWVGIHVVNLAFEQNNWGDSAIDETDLLFRADITKWKINTFTPYFIGGGLYDWNLDAFGLSVGLGGQLNFTKNVGLGADYSVQFLETGGKRGLAKLYLGFSF